MNKKIKKLLILMLIKYSPLNCEIDATVLLLSKQYEKPTAISNDFIRLGDNIASNQTMVSIDTPGYYTLKDNLKTNPTNNNVTFIRITTNNVILNLNSFNLSQLPSSAGTGSVGIEISANLSNIIIFNGSISLVKGTGIKINSGCHDIEILSVKISGCNKIGLDISSSNNINIKNLTVTNCDGSLNAPDEAIGIKLNSSDSIIITDSKFNNNQTVTANSIGAYLIGCANCKFINCDASLNKGIAAYGFKLASGTKACAFENCAAKYNQSTTDECHGFCTSSSINNEFKDCKALSNNSSASNSYGFCLNNAKYNSYTNCHAHQQDVSSSTGNSHGFYSSNGLGQIFNGCSAIGNTAGTTTSSVASGFTLENNETRSTIQHCNSSINDGNAGIGYGIKLGGTSNSTINCIVKNNYMYANKGNKQYGLKDFATVSSTLINNNIAFGHGSVLPLKDNKITDTGKHNFMFNTPSNVSPANVLDETDNANIKIIDSQKPLANLSINSN